MHPNDGRVVSNFIVQALKGEPITLYGTGSQSRSFCHVDDLVTGRLGMVDEPGGRKVHSLPIPGWAITGSPTRSGTTR
jgi:nucleoside-diphosphate-sugar epimerase